MNPVQHCTGFFIVGIIRVRLVFLANLFSNYLDIAVGG